MELSEQEIKHLAKLARIELTPNEVELFRGQISQILGYIEQINKVDLKEVKTVYSWDSFYGKCREDKVEKCPEDERKIILDNVPEKQYGFVKVKAVF